MSQELISSEDFTLIHDAKADEILLKKNGVECLSAKFKYDDSDGIVLLSAFSYLNNVNPEEKLVKKMTDMVSDYVIGKDPTKVKKIFCFTGKKPSEFVGDDNYKSADIGRLMIREARAPISETKELSAGITIEKLSAQIQPDDLLHMAQLLQQTYWGKDIDETYVQRALQNSIFYIARDKGKIVGIGRSPTNGDFAYISDMVVDQDHRQQHIGTALLQQLLTDLDKNNHRFVALIHAGQDDGIHATPGLYGEKGRFVNYQDSPYHNQIVFRYIKDLTPKEVQQMKKVNLFQLNQ